ncbi:MAG TPA: LytTR family DNA-binding domain-containing protein [Azospirillaceae bacterium]|nr:LytTR family DNA-binding domain-containing protein [Azospirillaceae bacterium]
MHAPSAAPFPQLALPLRNLLIVLGLGGVLGRLGPYDTFGSGAATYAYWIGLLAAGWAQVALALHALRQAPPLAGKPEPLLVVLAVLLAALPTTFEVAWAESLLRGRPVIQGIMLLGLYGDVVMILLAVSLPLSLVRGLEIFPAGRGPAEAPALRPGQEPPADPAPAAAAPFLKRVPARLGTELLALETEDHYLRIHTPLGSDLVLCSLGEALAGLPPDMGLRVHRSWWVAASAVAGSEREGDRLLLTLSGGLRVPVSRTYMLAVKERGWA